MISDSFFQTKILTPLENLIFGNRPLILAAMVLLTVFFAYHGAQVKSSASYLRMLPLEHEYIQNFLGHSDEMKGLSNSIRVAVEVEEGDIFKIRHAAQDRIFDTDDDIEGFVRKRPSN